MDCVNARYGNPHICREGRCLSLTKEGVCPGVLGLGRDNDSLRRPDPIIFGAYSHIPADGWRAAVPTLNYELAVEEINARTFGGVPGGASGTRRPFIAVICEGAPNPDLPASLEHLIDDLQVPAIIASLYTKDLLEAFETKGRANEVFFLNPLVAASTVTSLEDDGLLWHMLSSALDVAPAYLPLLELTEAHVRTLRAIPADEDLKVALVDARTPFLEDIALYLLEHGEVNGKSLAANESEGNFLRVRIDSALEVTTPVVADEIAEIKAFGPHIILAVAGREFVQIRNNLEDTVHPNSRPFYLASPYLYGISQFATQRPNDRTLGVNFAGATDRTLYEAYLAELKRRYTSPNLVLEGSENFYDAAYFLMYSIAGARDASPLTGRDVSSGMMRLITGSTRYNVGPGSAQDIVNLLWNTSSNIALHGTMGPPDFNMTTRARRGLPSVYCVTEGEFVPDVMSYDPAARTLEGNHPCLPFAAD